MIGAAAGAILSENGNYGNYGNNRKEGVTECFIISIILATIFLLMAGIITGGIRVQSHRHFNTMPSESPCFQLSQTKCITDCNCGWCNVSIQYSTGQVPSLNGNDTTLDTNTTTVINCLPALYYDRQAINPLCMGTGGIFITGSISNSDCRHLIFKMAMAMSASWETAGVFILLILAFLGAIIYKCCKDLKCCRPSKNEYSKV